MNALFIFLTPPLICLVWQLSPSAPSQDSFLSFVNRRFSGGRVVVTCHGELMWAFRLRFEGISQLRYREMQAARETHEKIHNCQIIVYSRQCPSSGKVSRNFRHMRFVCPWDPSLSGGEEWRPIKRGTSSGYSNAEMLAQARAFPRIYNNQMCSMDDPELKKNVLRMLANRRSSISHAP